jgi:hypothetical protein
MPAMPVDEQRWVALESIHAWAGATIRYAEACEHFRAKLQKLHENSFDHVALSRQFQVDRHMLLIAAKRLVDHVTWAISLKYLDETPFQEILVLAEDIKVLRDLNEHSIEYLVSGGEKGRKPQSWQFITEFGISDASGTIHDLIGGRLSWKQLIEVVRRMIEKLPDQYKLVYAPSAL